MFKRTFLALALFAGLLSPAYSAGTISLSLTQRLDNITAKPLNGGKLYFIQAGTTSTPQNAYQDSALTIPWPNPITLDAGGNIPQLFFADGSIKIRLTNAAGVNQIVADNIQVVGNSSGGGGGSPVDATTVLATGDIKARHGTGVLTGFVRLNGRTIGSATSGATERANADAQTLFEYLWSEDSNLPVSTGRGASANADWVANKTITLPDARNRALAGLGAMGSTDAGLLTGSSFLFGNGTILGAKVGVGTPRVLQTFNLPAYTPVLASGTANFTKSIALYTSPAATSTTSSGVINTVYDGGGPSNITFVTTAPISLTMQPQGGTSTAFDTVSPLLLVTFYMKL